MRKYLSYRKYGDLGVISSNEILENLKSKKIKKQK
jgi:hypothetical protein